MSAPVLTAAPYMKRRQYRDAGEKEQQRGKPQIK
jgi:hypothetical protein